jgi:hypothetical protein
MHPYSSKSEYQKIEINEELIKENFDTEYTFPGEE